MVCIVAPPSTLYCSVLLAPNVVVAARGALAFTVAPPVAWLTVIVCAPRVRPDPVSFEKPMPAARDRRNDDALAMAADLRLATEPDDTMLCAVARLSTVKLRLAGSAPVPAVADSEVVSDDVAFIACHALGMLSAWAAL